MNRLTQADVGASRRIDPAIPSTDYCLGFITRPINNTLFEGMSRIRNAKG